MPKVNIPKGNPNSSRKVEGGDIVIIGCSPYIVAAINIDDNTMNLSHKLISLVDGNRFSDDTFGENFCESDLDKYINPDDEYRESFKLIKFNECAIDIKFE